MKKTVTAKFDSIDTAEFAARGLKNNFHRISNIKIQYKNKPCCDNKMMVRDEQGSPINLGGNYLYSHLGMQNMSVAMTAADTSDVYQDTPPQNRPEWATTIEAKLVLHADPAAVASVTNKLRSFGGYDICVF